MIFNVNELEIEDAVNEGAPQPIDKPGAAQDYSDVVVKKPWGYEYLVFENEHVAIWMLHIVRKRKTSMHCHPNKKTGLIVVAGQAKFCSMDKEYLLEDLDGVVIEKGVYHSTEAFSELPVDPQSENGIWVMEIETPPNKEDLLRKQDAYGRQGKSYEGVDNMVHGVLRCLKFDEAEENEMKRMDFLDRQFILSNGLVDATLIHNEAIVSVISRDAAKVADSESINPYLTIGDLTPYSEFAEAVTGEDLSAYQLLIVQQNKSRVRVSDCLFSCIAESQVKQVFSVAGGSSMHLTDSLWNNEQLEYVATHHETAAAMAADGYARLTGKPGVALVTSGAGSTNMVTGVSGAWVDSIPTIFISGQAQASLLSEGRKLRQLGSQEINIVKIVESITKYAVTVTDPSSIKYHIQKAIHLATTGRKGPVWLDIPLDVQSQLIDSDKLDGFTPNTEETRTYVQLRNKAAIKDNIAECCNLIRSAKRPVLICGNGVRLAGAEKSFSCLADKLGLPIISSWGANDLIASDHAFYVGQSGIAGDRAGNFAVQNADLLLILGSRMSVPQVGFNHEVFARAATKIVVDIDAEEAHKTTLKADLAIKVDAKAFINELLKQTSSGNVNVEIDEWIGRCLTWKKKYPVILPEYKNNQLGVNSYHFIDCLSESLDKNAVIVTDMGSSLISTMQAFRTKQGQRLFSSCGLGTAGYGLCGAIGACYGTAKQQTICITGDGALQMSMQELQTISHNQLPIVIFVLNNKGYLTNKLMQQNHFGKFMGTEAGSGISFPDLEKVADTFGLRYRKIVNQDGLLKNLEFVLAQTKPIICELMMPENQLLIPKVASLKNPGGQVVSRPLEDAYPFLDREELQENMIVPAWETLQ